MIYIHMKSGNQYKFIGEAIDKTDEVTNRTMVVYQGKSGTLFVRESEEFHMKFKLLTP